MLAFGLLFIVTHNLYSQETGYKYFKNYSYKEYDHHAQNWGITQAKNGIIYVANQAGVLEFDGVSWRVIKVPGYDTVRSLAIDNTGTLYIGGKGEIGFLASDPKGSLKYVSLTNQLEKENQRNFSNVWRTYATKEGVYFASSELLFRWQPKRKQMKIWKPSRRFLYSFVIKDRLLIHQEKTGIMQIDPVSDSLALLSGDRVFTEAKERIFMIVPFDPNNPYDTGTNASMLLIGTRLKGFYLFDGKTIEPFPTGVDNYLKKSIPYHGIRLSSGDFALATYLGGLVIIDPYGGLKYIFDKTSGLQDDCVKYVFQDNQGNLWLCLDKGISKIEYFSPFFIYDDRSGLPGIVLSVVHHQTDVYAGTTQRLYVLHSHSKAFQPVPGIYKSCWSLLSIEDSLLAATSEGVFQVDSKNNSERKIVKDPSYVLLQSGHHPGRTWCGTHKGLTALARKNNLWQVEHRLETFNQVIRYIAEDKNGNMWLITSTGSVLKVDFVDSPVNIHQSTVTWYETSHGLPGGRVYAAKAAGHVMFATERGIFRFDEKKKVFIPDLTIGNEFAGGPESKNVFRIAEDKNKNIWVHSQSRNFQAIPGPRGSFTINTQPFRRIPLIQVNAIYPDPDGKNIWFASFDGLIRYDTTIKKNYQQDFRTLVRKVLVNEKLVFDGYKNKTGKAGKGLFPIIEYENRNLHFEFSAPFFEVETDTQYRCFLEGYDKTWSSWNNDTKRNYTNLDPGMYSFRVRAKNIYQHQGVEDVFRFKVLPPWYKTWWAFLLYGIGFFLLMFLVVKWRSIKLEHEKQKLEYTIKERTKEIQQKNKQLKEQSDKLKEMDRVKSRFFANISHEFRTPLTLIMGSMEQMLSENRDKKEKNRLNLVLRNSQRLLTLINQLLDLSRFDSGTMKLQAARQDIVPLLKGTLASFHLLAQQNKLELEFVPGDEEIFLYFDARKMEEVMYNLLINAVKFTPAGGKIGVSVTGSRQDRFVEISVHDTGIGIPKEQLAHVFDRFYQAKTSNGKDHKGTGIGLALIKEIVLLHHGKIDVHSQEGKGTEFVIRLPMGHEHLQPDEISDFSAAPAKPQKNKEIEALYMITENENQIEEETEKEEEEVEKQDQEKPVILVVEDNAEVRKYICDPLKQDYSVIEAADGKEGIEKAREIIPDLIVSDIMMPEIDGCELCRVLKKDIKTSHVPIILLTAKASEESIIQGLETGADDYITKPFNSKILMTRIKNLIELRSHLQQKIQKQMLLQPAEISVSSMDQEFIKELQEIIEKNLSDFEFNVEKLSELLIMNRATLYRKIMALAGENPTQFIRSYRLKRAAQLLRDKFGTVSQVAVEVGFSNMAYFAERFKEKFHQLPSTYQASKAK